MEIWTYLWVSWPSLVRDRTSGGLTVAVAESLAGNEGEANELWLNDGSGTFTAANGGPTQGSAHTFSVAVADFDGDGDGDLFVGATLCAQGLLLAAASLTFVKSTRWRRAHDFVEFLR